MMMVKNSWWHMLIGPTIRQRLNIVHMRREGAGGGGGVGFVVVWAISSF